MANVKNFKCFNCGTTYLPEEVSSLSVMRCTKCSGSLDAEYDYDSIKQCLMTGSFRRETPAHWKYWPFLPISDLSSIISMGEGGTALITQKALRQYIGASSLHIKCEANNPTGSFKDRGTSLEITKAIENGNRKVVVASTGNMGASIAAYCAFTDIQCVVFVPDIVADSKIKQMIAHGADVRHVDGDYSVAMKAAEEHAQSCRDAFLTGDYPWRGEGTKTVGFEILDQLYWKVPDYVVTPIGNGTLIWALYKAFREMMCTGLTDSIPHIIGVQAERCDPVVTAWDKGSGTIVPVKDPDTIATAIACGDPIDGIAALRSIRESDGMGISVDDDEIIAARNMLAKHGIFVEPSGAVAYAGALKAKEILQGQTVVCLATGHGLKDMYGL